MISKRNTVMTSFLVHLTKENYIPILKENLGMTGKLFYAIY